MNSQAVFMYVLKAILISGIFLGYYWLALRNRKFHSYNRFYLLFSLALSVGLPLLNFTWIAIDQPMIYGTGEVLEYMINRGKSPAWPALNWMDWVLVCGLLVAAILLIVLFINITKIYRLKRNSVVTKMNDIDFIDTEEDNAPFSYLNNLFWKRSIPLEQEEGKRIFKHELTHIRQKHTLDRLFCQLLCSVIWINPFYWIIQKELLTIHEFIADEEAIDASDTESFARMLLQAHYGNHFLQQTQSFFYSSIKRRLLMLTTPRNTRYSYIRRLIALPLLAFIIAVFTFQVVAREENKTGGGITPAHIKEEGASMLKTDPGARKQVTVAITKKSPATSSKGKGKYDTTIQVQEEPAFPGGKDGWRRFLETTCNHDKPVEKGCPPGRFTVQLSFIVDREGDVRDVVALNDPGYGTKEDAMRTLLSSPKWIPAKLNGKPVVYRNRITITYQVSED